MTNRFKNRGEAGRILAQSLQMYAGRDDLIVLAVPRGGVPVGFELCKALRAPLDAVIIRKILLPNRVAAAAVAADGTLLTSLDTPPEQAVSYQCFHAAAEQERRRAVEEEMRYRGNRPPPDIQSRIVLLVDDGLTTGVTLRTAAEAIRLHHPARLIAAIPTGCASACELLKTAVDAVLCLSTRGSQQSIERAYEEFNPVADSVIRDMINESQELFFPAIHCR